MRINSINSLSTIQPLKTKLNAKHIEKRDFPVSQQADKIAFKGDSGAFKGMFWGAIAGFTVAAVTIATGGLAGVVAAGGASCILGGGAGVGAQMGGIIGGLSEGDGSDEKK